MPQICPKSSIFEVKPLKINDLNGGGGEIRSLIDGFSQPTITPLNPALSIPYIILLGLKVLASVSYLPQLCPKYAPQQIKLSSPLHSWGFEPKHAPRAHTHTPANTHFRKFVNALKRVKTPSKIHEKYTNLNMEAFA